MPLPPADIVMATMVLTHEPTHDAPQRTGRPWPWFAAGVLTALFLMATQALALGGWTALLAVGDDASVRELIEAEIPDLVTVPGSGNDPQIYYTIALDPFSDTYAELLPESSLRWRRILVPVTTSLFGTIGGAPLFWAMVGLTAISLGGATAVLERLRARWELPRWTPAIMLVHPGVWIAVRLISIDMPALWLSLLAVFLALRSRWALVTLVLCALVLTKEPYLLVAFSIGAWAFFARHRLAGVTIAAVPTAVLAAWSIGVRQFIDGPAFEGGNVSWPFAGIIEASRWWGDIAASQNVLTAMALIMVVTAAAIGIRYRGHALLHWLLWPWIALSLVTSHWVWRFGNGSLRAFSIIAVFAAIMLADVIRERSDRTPQAGLSGRSQRPPSDLRGDL